MEKKDHQLYRRPYMMGKARGKEEEEEEVIQMKTAKNWESERNGQNSVGGSIV